MSVAAHLGIALDEYDARIRTFIPDYEEMIAAGAASVPRHARTIVDLGIGTGALAAQCLRFAPHARFVGIDADPAIVELAARRIGTRGRFVSGSFLTVEIPRCDAVVASFALHHVRTRKAKGRLYRRIALALRPRGVFATVDCHPSSVRLTATAQHDAWAAHLAESYGPVQARRFLRAWAHEDVYVPLETELEIMLRAGLKPDLIWRKGGFAVIRAVKR